MAEGEKVLPSVDRMLTDLKKLDYFADPNSVLQNFRSTLEEHSARKSQNSLDKRKQISSAEHLGDSSKAPTPNSPDNQELTARSFAQNGVAKRIRMTSEGQLATGTITVGQPDSSPTPDQREKAQTQRTDYTMA